MNFLGRMLAALVIAIWFFSIVALGAFALIGIDYWPVWVCVLAGVLGVIDLAAFAAVITG